MLFLCYGLLVSLFPLEVPLRHYLVYRILLISTMVCCYYSSFPLWWHYLCSFILLSVFVFCILFGRICSLTTFLLFWPDYRGFVFSLTFSLSFCWTMVVYCLILFVWMVCFYPCSVVNCLWILSIVCIGLLLCIFLIWSVRCSRSSIFGQFALLHN